MTAGISARLLRLNLEELHGARTHLTFSHGRIAGLEAERASCRDRQGRLDAICDRVAAYSQRLLR